MPRALDKMKKERERIASLHYGFPGASLHGKAAVDDKFKVGLFGEQEFAKKVKTVNGSFRCYWSLAFPYAYSDGGLYSSGSAYDGDVDCVIEFDSVVLVLDIKNYNSAYVYGTDSVNGDTYLEVYNPQELKLVDRRKLHPTLYKASANLQKHFGDKPVVPMVVFGSTVNRLLSIGWPDESGRKVVPVVSDEDVLSYLGRLHNSIPEVNSDLLKLLNKPIGGADMAVEARNRFLDGRYPVDVLPTLRKARVQPADVVLCSRSRLFIKPGALYQMTLHPHDLYDPLMLVMFDPQKGIVLSVFSVDEYRIVESYDDWLSSEELFKALPVAEVHWYRIDYFTDVDYDGSPASYVHTEDLYEELVAKAVSHSVWS